MGKVIITRDGFDVLCYRAYLQAVEAHEAALAAGRCPERADELMEEARRAAREASAVVGEARRIIARARAEDQSLVDELAPLLEHARGFVRFAHAVAKKPIVPRETEAAQDVVRQLRELADAAAGDPERRLGLLRDAESIRRSSP